jgi:putative transferase (TIGR04331 family)
MKTKYAINSFDRLTTEKKVFNYELNSFKDLEILRNETDHWDNISQITKDYKYLFKIYQKLINQLTIILNKTHKQKKSKRYWSILIGPWLWFFLDNTYERYNSVQFFLKKNKNKKINFCEMEVNKNFFPKCLEQTSDFYYSDIWNYKTCIDILKNISNKNINLIKLKNPKYNSKIKQKLNFFDKKLKSLSSDCYYTNLTKKELIFENCFSRKILLNFFFMKRSIFIKKNKINFSNFFIRSKFNNEMRENIKIKLNKKNKYEKFLSTFIINEMPCSFLENYRFINSTIFKSQLPKNVQNIYASYQIWFNSIATFYVADLVENNKTKLHYFQHGADYGFSSYNFYEYHEKYISDLYYTWGWNINSKKVIPFKVTKNKINAKYNPNNNIILVVVRTSRKYFRLGSSQIGFKNWINYLYDTFKLPQKIQKKQNITIRLYKTNYWNEKKIFKKLYKNLKVDCSFKKIDNQIRNSKIVICTYLSTLFLELININFPVVIIYSLENNIIDKKKIKVLNNLKKNKILFENATDAAEHINSINISDWWFKPKTQKVINNFRANFCR